MPARHGRVSSVLESEADERPQAMSILKGQVPWRKRQRIEQPMHPSTPPQPLRSSMSAPTGALETLAQPADEDASDGEWSMQGPYNFDRWRDMIEKSVLAPCMRMSTMLMPLIWPSARQS